MTHLADGVSDFKYSVVRERTKAQEQGSSHHHKGCTQWFDLTCMMPGRVHERLGVDEQVATVRRRASECSPDRSCPSVLIRAVAEFAELRLMGVLAWRQCHTLSTQNGPHRVPSAANPCSSPPICSATFVQLFSSSQ